MTIPDDGTRPASTPQAKLPSQETLPSSIRPARQGEEGGLSISTDEEEEVQPRRGRGCARRGVILALIGLLLLCSIGGLSAWGGYRSAIDARKGSKATSVALSVQTQYALAMKDLSEGRSQLVPTRFAWFKDQPLEARTISQEVALELQVQFQLGVRDLEEKRYNDARQRFEWILEWDPSFPGITEKLADAFYQISVTATSTPLPPTPTPSLTPTPDLRDVQKLFTDAQLAMLGGDWSVAIDTLLSLRKRDVAYYPVQVDDMLYVALRYRGMDKIYGNGKTDTTITKVDLEGGMYDLQLAEAFGPLDRDAQTARRRAQWYVTGLSTWGVDWPKSISYFELLANEAPYFLDSENWPAIERFRMALMGYGDWLANQGDCQGAQVQYQRALELGPNAKLEATATAMVEKCPTVTPTLTPPGTITGTVTSTPTLTPTIPVDTPVPGESTPTPTPTPTLTPTQALTPTPTETPTLGENTLTPTPTETLTPEANTPTPTPTETPTG